MNNKYFILHLSLIDDIGSITIQKIIQCTKSDFVTSDFYFFSVLDWMHYYGIKETTAQKIVTGLADKKTFETELHLIEKHHIQWITIVDDIYPSLLREIYIDRKSTRLNSSHRCI